MRSNIFTTGLAAVAALVNATSVAETTPVAVLPAGMTTRCWNAVPSTARGDCLGRHCGPQGFSAYVWRDMVATAMVCSTYAVEPTAAPQA
ncbi:hypothetical protein LTR62_005665 [Meristemomyces frigidus]|uniref:Uncharacterized protein n=1 Tax=Meristemomyces frigidus TaxID=1508187 RepID=A0AAN7YF53_9PEZI|nr:hypothetical protein LTR62_005665 [Meristemomyces frigidus]